MTNCISRAARHSLLQHLRPLFAGCHSNRMWPGEPWIMLLSPPNFPRPEEEGLTSSEQAPPQSQPCRKWPHVTSNSTKLQFNPQCMDGLAPRGSTITCSGTIQSLVAVLQKSLAAVKECIHKITCRSTSNNHSLCHLGSTKSSRQTDRQTDR